MKKEKQEEILSLHFLEKAVSEIKERLKKNKSQKFCIQTFHAYCLYILQNTILIL